VLCRDSIGRQCGREVRKEEKMAKRLIPYREDPLGLTLFHDRMNRLFDSFFHEGGHRASEGLHWPTLDLIETPENLQVKAELPGIDPKQLEISITGNTLTIRGEKTEEKEEKGKTWHHRERSSGSFVRSITLPLKVDAEHVEAVDEHGVLTITLPKLEPEKAKRIEVKAK
jgi:HSP20 family protein